MDSPKKPFNTMLICEGAHNLQAKAQLGVVDETRTSFDTRKLDSKIAQRKLSTPCLEYDGTHNRQTKAQLSVVDETYSLFGMRTVDSKVLAMH